MANIKEIIAINSIYESCRALLMYSESMAEEIGNISNLKLRESLREYLQTAQANILTLADFSVELLNCESELDLETLLELNKNEVDN